jgi:hypothetical protein
MNQSLQSELANIVPRELALNVDFWQRIVENINMGMTMVPLSFINHLAHKYGYSVEYLRDPEVLSYIWNLSLHLNKNPDSFRTLAKTTVSYNLTYGYSESCTYKNAYKTEKPVIKDRNKLTKEIPLADFN